MDDQIALKYSCIIFAVTAVVLFVLYLFLRSGNRKKFQRIRHILVPKQVNFPRLL